VVGSLPTSSHHDNCKGLSLRGDHSRPLDFYVFYIFTLLRKAQKGENVKHVKI